MVKKGEMFGVRLNGEDMKQFACIVEEERSNKSSMSARIIHDWIHFMKSKQERGDITLAGEIIKNLINALPPENIARIAKKNAKYVISEMKWQNDDLDFAELSKRIVEWNMENDRKLIPKEKPGLVLFKQRHELGMGWSVHQCEMYSEMFRLIGETINTNSVKHDKTSFSFEVIRHG